MIKFDEKGLVPAIAQDINTSEVLMMAYMNKEALEKTLSTGNAYFYSRSRKRLWLKGETSGNFLEVRGVYYDCDCDTVLALVEPKGPACHTGERSCFYRALSGAAKPARGATHAPAGPEVLKELYKIIKKRKKADPAKSYVASLYAKGVAKINEKIAEESGELIEAAGGATPARGATPANVKDKKEIVHETADLWFHTLVLLSCKEIEVGEVFKELGRRLGVSGMEERESRGKK